MILTTFATQLHPSIRVATVPLLQSSRVSIFHRRRHTNFPQPEPYACCSLHWLDFNFSTRQIAQPEFGCKPTLAGGLKLALAVVDYYSRLQSHTRNPAVIHACGCGKVQAYGCKLLALRVWENPYSRLRLKLKLAGLALACGCGNYWLCGCGRNSDLRLKLPAVEHM